MILLAKFFEIRKSFSKLYKNFVAVERPWKWIIYKSKFDTNACFTRKKIALISASSNSIKADMLKGYVMIRTGLTD